MLQHAGRRSLLLLDELGRGTSTHDGYAIAFAVLHHIALRSRSRCKICQIKQKFMFLFLNPKTLRKDVSRVFPT